MAKTGYAGRFAQGSERVPDGEATSPCNAQHASKALRAKRGNSRLPAYEPRARTCSSAVDKAASSAACAVSNTLPETCT